MRLVLLALFGLFGCGASDSCIFRGHGGAYDECVASRNYHESEESKRERKRQEQEQADKLAQHQREARAKYDAAVEPCKRGEPEPCFVVAMYEMTNRHDDKHVDAAFEVACNGKVAKACVLRGKRGGGLAWYERACALDAVDGCLAAATADPPRAMTFEIRACDLKDAPACERVGLTYADQHHADAEQYLKRACAADRKAACRRLGELAVQQ